MLCCSKCLADAELVNLVENSDRVGDCGLCGRNDVKVVDISPDSDVFEGFSRLVGLYIPETELSYDHPADEIRSLGEDLKLTWRIFSEDVKPEAIDRLLAELFEDNSEYRDVLCGRVGMGCLAPSAGLVNSLLNGNDWKKFMDGIKHHLRYHGRYLNEELFKNIVDKLKSTSASRINAGEVFYRGRICERYHEFSPSEMGAPPAERAWAGRINSEGIRVLYLAEDRNTVLHEIRAGMHNRVCIGEFVSSRELDMVDLASLGRISPFIGFDDDDDRVFGLRTYAANLGCLRMMAREIAEPARGGNPLDYLPTQYICDFFRSLGIEAIAYDSAMLLGGRNLASFEVDAFRCKSVDYFEVKDLQYQTEPSLQ